MPPSSDRPTQEPLLNLDPDLQGGGRKRSPSRKKSRRKNESQEESTGAGGSLGGLRNELTSPSSILAQLHKSTSPPAIPRNDPSPPSFEAWSAAPSLYSQGPTRNANDWASNIPFGRSPPEDRSNGISMAGSPPDYRQESDGTMRHAINPTSAPTSPRANYRQLVRRNNEYQSVGNYLSSSPGSRRPLSVHSNFPSPHQPQAHFYGAPELDFGIPRSDSKQRGPEQPTCCSFDYIYPSGQELRDRSGDVLLLGSHHSLDVFHVDRRRFDRVGRLSNLRGPILQAAILPPLSDRDEVEFKSPLVAMIIHGPSRLVDQGELQPSDSIIHEARTADPEFFETTVEVYSLKTGSHIQTLFTSPKINVDPRNYTSHVQGPKSAADLVVQAQGKFVIVSSGRSGEVFIFENNISMKDDQTHPFQCIGKIWTKIGSRISRHSSMSSTDSDLAGIQDHLLSDVYQPQSALVSLSSRWLAYVPPTSSAQTSLHGNVTGDHGAQRIHGVSSHASPSEPAVTCQLDTPDAESFINRVARDGAQTLMKGAQWVGNQGMQAWNNYWTKPADTGSQRFSSSLPQNAGTGAFTGHQTFPPTHAQDTKGNAGRNRAALISILDLEKLSQGQHLKTVAALEPIATFSLRSGCSLVSFAPDGLKLLTASLKGDVQQIWDLMRMVHGDTGRYKDADPSLQGSTVREVARFTRMTEAKIVDVVWSEPRGSRLAVITDKGTVHIYDMPSSAFQWPPPRRSSQDTRATVQRSVSGQQDIGTSVRSQTTGSSLSSAFGMFSSTTQPIFAAVRGRRPSSGSSFPSLGGFSATAGIGAKGGKAVAAGVNRSVSAAAVGTYNTIRHLGENRIALPNSAAAETLPGRVQWLTGKDQAGALAVTGAGLVRIYGIRQSSHPTKAGRRRPSALGDKPAEFPIPRYGSDGAQDNVDDAQTYDANDPQMQHQQEHPTAQGGASGESFWHLTPATRPASRNAKAFTHPLSYAEIDTSAAYQPFHTDRRVGLYAYNQDPLIDIARTDTATKRRRKRHDVGSSSNAGIWLFGQPIPATKISSGSTDPGDEDEDNDIDGGAVVDSITTGLYPYDRHAEIANAVTGDIDRDTIATDMNARIESVVRIASSEGAGQQHERLQQPDENGQEGSQAEEPEQGGQQQQIVITTRRRRKKGTKLRGDVYDVDSTADAVAANTPSVSGRTDANAREEDEIFENDCEVVDFVAGR